MPDQSATEALFVETSRRCVTEDSIEAAPLIAEIIDAVKGGNVEFLHIVANAAVSYVDDMGGMEPVRPWPTVLPFCRNRK